MRKYMLTDAMKPYCAFRGPSEVKVRARSVSPLWVSVVSLCFVISLCSILSAQNSTGQFNGHVTDPSGAAVNGAVVTLVDVPTGVQRTASTNDQGYYQFPQLAPSIYKLSVTQSGFQPEVTKPTKLDVNQVSTLDFGLHVGQAMETVTVSSSAELLQASTTELGTVIEQKAVNDLPLNGRNFTALLLLTPGVSPSNTSQFGTPSYAYNGGGPALPNASVTFPSIQGQWNREQVYFIDGIINSNPYAGTYDIPPIIDGLQEFKVQSHNDGAEFGGVLGGVINIVTKSGTNSLHGSAWEYLRNDFFDARNSFTDANSRHPGEFRQNEFGFSVGGPVVIPKLYNGRNKTFFFFAYEGWRFKQAAQLQYVTPTAAELGGDFRNPANGNHNLLYDPFTTVQTAPGVYTRQLFPAVTLPDGSVCPAGQCVPASAIDPVTQAYLQNYLGHPNVAQTTPGGFNTQINTAGSNNAGQYTGRLDQNFGEKNSLWFRYSILNGRSSNPQTAIYSSVNGTNNKNFGGGITHVFSPNFILDARVGLSGRYNALSGSSPNIKTPTGFEGLQKIYGNVSFALGSGYNSTPGFGPGTATIKEYNYAINATLIHGNHQFRFGIQQIKSELAQGISGVSGNDNNFNFTPFQTANPTLGGGNAIASALLGLPDQARFQAQKNDFYYIPSDAYFQDSWKVSPKLTVNLGLRWDGESSPRIKVGLASDLDPRTGNTLISGGKLPPPCSSTQFAPCLPNTGFVIPGNGPVTPAQQLALSHVIASPNPNIGPNGVYNDFGPRVGVAYKLTPTTVVRVGYGLVYDNIQGAIQTLRDRIGDWPGNSSIVPSYNQAAATAAGNFTTAQQVAGTLSGVQVYPSQNGPPSATSNWGWDYDPHMKNHYSHQYNVEIQKELSSSLVATAAYVGSVNRRLPYTALFNNSPNPGGRGLDRPFPWAGTSIMATDRGTANFNAGEFKLDKRLSGGLGFLISYTYSKGMDNGMSGFFASENGSPGWGNIAQNYNNLNANYGISATSLKHILSTSFTYELPFGHGKPMLDHGLASYALGGWQMNGILSAHSGAPLTLAETGIQDPACIGNNIYGDGRPDQIGNPSVSHPTKELYFNKAAFTASAKCTYGNAGRGTIVGPKYVNLDFSMFKGFNVTERAALQFRAEFFNVLNIINYGNPQTDFSAGNFGQINYMVGTPRQMQFSLRLQF